MENQYYNLSEDEFSKSRKILLWIFVSLFFLAGVYILLISLVFGKHSIEPALSIAPFGISLIVSVFALFATIKSSNMYFVVDDDKIEFRYGMLNPKKHSYKWADIQGFKMPGKQKKVMILFKDGSSFVINLTWIQRRKASLIRKNLYYVAKVKNLNIIKVMYL